MKLGSVGSLTEGVRKSILLLMLQFLFAVHKLKKISCVS